MYILYSKKLSEMLVLLLNVKAFCDVVFLSRNIPLNLNFEKKALFINIQ